MSEEIKMIPIDQIRILNPRHRDRRKFELILESIKHLGLKKPIQISRRGKGEDGEAGYDLVCGQGRIEAFLALGHKEIPAIVVQVSPEERLLRSLVENIARRHPSPMELMREIERLRGLVYTIEATPRSSVSATRPSRDCRRSSGPVNKGCWKRPSTAPYRFGWRSTSPKRTRPKRSGNS
jgi:ParB family chromosome partitioning protein